MKQADHATLSFIRQITDKTKRNLFEQTGCTVQRGVKVGGETENG